MNETVKDASFKVYKHIYDSISNQTLSSGLNRKLAWCLLLGISKNTIDEFYKQLYEGYLEDAFNLEKSTYTDFEIQR